MTATAANKAPLIEMRGLQKHFLVKKSFDKSKQVFLKAVDGVDLTIHHGETVGLVGESGCGKSTLGRTVLKLHSITGGQVLYEGEDITGLSDKAMHPYRKKMQIVFQDPFASLNPRKTIYETVKAPLEIFKEGDEASQRAKVSEILEVVGLGTKYLNKYPHEMSGGQRQRVAIARALINDPNFVVCDEPVSALDVSVRSQVLNLMKDLQEERKLAYLFISHDLSVVRYLCDKVAVMYLGKMMEVADKEELFEHSLHPYTRALLSSIPIPDVDAKRSKIILEGDVPSPLNPPQGCYFCTRCPYANERCHKETPKLETAGENHQVACLRYQEIWG